MDRPLYRGLLLACPFCGSQGLEVLPVKRTERGTDIVDGYKIMCPTCLATGPGPHASLRLAGKDWNQRANVGNLSDIIGGMDAANSGKHRDS